MIGFSSAHLEYGLLRTTRYSDPLLHFCAVWQARDAGSGGSKLRIRMKRIWPWISQPIFQQGCWQNRRERLRRMTHSQKKCTW